MAASMTGSLAAATSPNTNGSGISSVNNPNLVNNNSNLIGMGNVSNNNIMLGLNATSGGAQDGSAGDIHAAGGASAAASGDGKTDQKMIFLLQQLNTLETMLTSTKKELSRLEASLQDSNGNPIPQNGAANQTGSLLNNSQAGAQGLQCGMKDAQGMMNASGYYETGIMQV